MTGLDLDEVTVDEPIDDEGAEEMDEPGEPPQTLEKPSKRSRHDSTESSSSS